jgi:chemotaxis protein MotB
VANGSGPKKKAKKAVAGAPAWMVTFSDMVTLLLTFFVLLLSMATMDKVKFENAAGSLKGAFGVLSSADLTKMDDPRVMDFAPIDDDLTTRLYQNIRATMKRLKLDEDMELVRDRGAVVLRIKESVLFGAGSTELKPLAHEVLRKVASLVRPLPLSLRIEGHTDDTPTRNPQLDNWDISTSRSVAVLKFFAKQKLIPLGRMSALGYGSEQPRVPNTSVENRALNRRVEFVMESLQNYREELPYLIDAKDQLPF